MATFTWSLQGTSDTTIDDTDKIQYAAGTFDSLIAVDSYNDSTHVENSGGTDDSSGNTPNNVKYISTNQGDWGDGTESLSNITDGECTLKINFSHTSAVSTSSAIFYAYDGSTTTSGPTNVTFYAAEGGDTNWTNAEGSGSAVSLTDQSSASSHDFYIASSASPSAVGEQSNFKARIELTYS